MLVLSRKVGESVIIRNDIKVTILEISGNQIKLGFEAPSNVSIYREEVYKSVMKENKAASKVRRDSLKSFAKKFKK